MLHTSYHNFASIYHVGLGDLEQAKEYQQCAAMLVGVALVDEAKYDIKSSVDRGCCYSPRQKAEADRFRTFKVSIISHVMQNQNSICVLLFLIRNCFTINLELFSAVGLQNMNAPRKMPHL